VRALSWELGGRGITVNAISPGPTETDMMQDRYRDRAAGSSPFNRVVDGQLVSRGHRVPSSIAARTSRHHLGTSNAGFLAKKPAGRSVKPAVVALITGQSSGRGMCVTPNVYQATTS
jgi:NAD(P)-dependent dehydrogenase (short-subunit alcohol dehydrogenase family)